MQAEGKVKVRPARQAAGAVMRSHVASIRPKISARDLRPRSLNSNSYFSCNASALCFISLPSLAVLYMSQPEQKIKKRKHASAVTDMNAGVGEPSTKRSKGDKVKKDKLKSKSKGKEAVVGEFRVIQASLPLSIPPVFANKLRAGAEEMLDSLLMRCAVRFRVAYVYSDNKIVCFLEDTFPRYRESSSPIIICASLIRVPLSRRTALLRIVASASKQQYGALMSG